MWRRLTFPQGCPCSIISAERLSFRVRNGNGRFPLAKTTAKVDRVFTLKTAWSVSTFSVRYDSRRFLRSKDKLKTKVIKSSTD